MCKGVKKNLFKKGWTKTTLFLKKCYKKNENIRNFTYVCIRIRTEILVQPFLKRLLKGCV